MVYPNNRATQAEDRADSVCSYDAYVTCCVLQRSRRQLKCNNIVVRINTGAFSTRSFDGGRKSVFSWPSWWSPSWTGTWRGRGCGLPSTVFNCRLGGHGGRGVGDFQEEVIMFPQKLYTSEDSVELYTSVVCLYSETYCTNYFTSYHTAKCVCVHAYMQKWWHTQESVCSTSMLQRSPRRNAHCISRSRPPSQSRPFLLRVVLFPFFCLMNNN